MAIGKTTGNMKAIEAEAKDPGAIGSTTKRRLEEQFAFSWKVMI
jgi:hypothetical protein